MPSSDIRFQLAEEQILASLHHGIQAIRRKTGSCSVDDISTHLIQQLGAGLLREASPAPHARTETGSLDTDALVRAAYVVETTIADRAAQVRFTPGLAKSGLAHGEHLDIRATVLLRNRVDLTFMCGLVSTDRGATWSLALTTSDKSRLASAKTMKGPVGEQVTALVHDPGHRRGLEPVIDAARHVAGMRALGLLAGERQRLALAGARAVAARAVFDRYGYSEADMTRLRTHLAQLAAADHKGLVDW
ncbi:hypothetical protein ACFY1P_19975 [Streptomyces sp. NPDC001407]|uniref:hypothetical protein n=1 Tax=Streptomyces sp. NPDC001407 TaxID=3364573 RepID=UPI00367BCB04